jgi:hypothetical protein
MGEVLLERTRYGHPNCLGSCHLRGSPWSVRREPSPPAGILWCTVVGGDGHGILQQLDGGQGGHWIYKEKTERLWGQ